MLSDGREWLSDGREWSVEIDDDGNHADAPIAEPLFVEATWRKRSVWVVLQRIWVVLQRIWVVLQLW
jgi:hypothetical protein